MRNGSGSLPASVAAVAIALATSVLVEDISLRPSARMQLAQGKSWADEVSESVRSEKRNGSGQTTGKGAEGQRAHGAPAGAGRSNPAGSDGRATPAGQDRRP